MYKPSLSLDTTCYTIFEHWSWSTNLKTDNVILQQIDCTKYVGIFIDSSLSLENRIDYIYTYNKIKFVGILRYDTI